MEFFYLNYGFLKRIGTQLFEIALPEQVSNNAHFLFFCSPFHLRPGETLSGKINLSSSFAKILKIEINDSINGRTFSDLHYTVETQTFHLFNHLNVDVIIYLKIFLSSPTNETFILDLSQLTVSAAQLPQVVKMTPSSTTDLEIKNRMVGYHCTAYPGVWKPFGNGLEIKIIDIKPDLNHHNIRLELFSFNINSGILSFVLETEANITLKIFVEEKDGYGFWLTDATYLKYSPGTHQVDFHFSWDKEFKYPDLFIQFHLAELGSFKLHQLTLRT